MDSAYKFVDIHTHRKPNSDSVSAVVNLFPGENPTDAIPFGDNLYSVGIHPWFAREESCEGELQAMRTLALRLEIVAIGECGIDKICKTPMELQKRIFIRQIELSEEISKPLIIHCVRSVEEIIRIRKDLHPKSPWIYHGFRSGPETMRQLVRNRICVSFGPILKHSKRLAEAFREAPGDMIFLETDNSDIPISETYRIAAEIRGCDMELLTGVIHANFKRIFRREDLEAT